MYTVCPKCTLALAVTAADLRAGQGYVRCGRCSNVFNALLGLREETDTSPGLPLEPPPPEEPPEAPPEPARLGGADRRAAAREPPPQGGLDLDLSPPAVPAPAPERDEAIDLALDADSTGENTELDLVLEPDDLAAAPMESVVLEEPGAGEEDIVLELRDEPLPAEAREAIAPLRVFATPAATVAVAPAPLAPAAAAAAAAPATSAPIAAATAATTSAARGLPARGLTPLSVEVQGGPLPVAGLTPLRATRDEPIADPGLEADEFRGTGTYETIVLQGDSILQTEELLPEQDIDDRIAAVAHQLGVDGAGAGPAAPAAPRSLAARARSTAPVAPTTTVIADPGEGDAGVDTLAADIAAAVAQLGPAPISRRQRWAAPAAAILLALLAIQAVHHWRNRLATLPALHGPLTHLYAALGAPLAPEWDLAAYDLRLLGASADPGDNRVIHVRMSLASRASAPQDLPLVRLRLIDRYGKAISSGELAPAQYLPAAQLSLRQLGPDQRIDSDVRVQDPTQQASSFELDVCLPRAGGGVRCAGEASFSGSRP